MMLIEDANLLGGPRLSAVKRIKYEIGETLSGDWQCFAGPNERDFHVR
jgi:hypothetical protein